MKRSVNAVLLLLALAALPALAADFQLVANNGVATTSLTKSAVSRSGIGWPAGCKSTRRTLAGIPSGTFTTPPAIRRPRRCSTARAMAALAFPAPIT